MQSLHLKFDRFALHDTFFDHTWILAYNAFRNVRVMAADRPDRPSSDGEDQRYNRSQRDWTLDEVIMPLKAVVRCGDFLEWEEPPLTPLEAAIQPFVAFERETAKGVCLRRGDAIYWQTWSAVPLYRAGTFTAFEEAVANLDGLAKAIQDQRHT